VSVVAIDLSPAQVELCRAKGLDARVRDMYDLGFEPGSFGAVWMMNCIHHVPSQDLRAVLDGIRGVLVPGGLLYLGVWGGIDSEGMPVEDFYQPPRYFCFRSDASLRTAVEEVFTVDWFETFTPGEGDPGDELWMQSLVARSS
jgi:SAM-dependent methyltransferase